MKEYSDQEKSIQKAFVRLARASESVTAVVHDKVSDDGLTASQFGVLEALYHHKCLSHKDLAAKILKSSGNITLVIDNLEKRDLVVRHMDTSDRRKMLVSLSEKGESLIGKVLPDHLGRIYKVYEVLEENELETFSNLCKKIGIYAATLNR